MHSAPAFFGLALVLAYTVTALAEDRPGPADAASAAEGKRLLSERPLIPAHFDQETFDGLWEVWPKALHDAAAKATPAVRRAMAFRRYGLDPHPDDATKPLQYIVDAKGNFTMSCLACHGGSVEGRVVPGLPNTHFALQTLADDVFRYKVKHDMRPTGFDLGSRVVPMGTTVGTTNAVVFSVTLLRYRDKDLKVLRKPLSFDLNHHDLDAPPWWHYRKRSRIYIDGLAPKGHRSLMQFMLVPSNGRAAVLEAEAHFKHIAAYLESLEAPAYEGEVDRVLADKGRVVFGQHCAICHGTYGEEWTYPNQLVPIEDVGTDRVRLDALSKAQRRSFADSWLTGYQPETAIVDPGGYVAPPLDGIWATAPYFHNGSVPTLWHVLHPEDRPRVWRRSRERLDRDKMGLTIEAFPKVPGDVRDAAVRRHYFDTSKRGKGAQGHRYPDALSEAERRSVLEYLKTL